MMVREQRIIRQFNRILAKTGYTSSEAMKVISHSIESGINIDELQNDIHEWSVKVFGDEKTDHNRIAEMNQSIIDESNELVNNPYSLLEYADLFITMLNSMTAAGYTFNNLIVAANIKMVINKERKWYRIKSTRKLYHVERDER